MGSQIMIARIEESPRRAIRTDYADAWMRYGNRVSADYSFNYVPSRSVFSVFADSSGMALVHFSLEIDPQNFTLETDEQKSKFYTTLDLSIEAISADGELVVATDKEAYVELTPSQMRELGSRPFAYQDDFPLVPGDFDVTVIVRNRVVTQYTVAESKIHIARFTKEEPALTDIILAFDSSLVGGTLDDTLVRTYQVGKLRLQPAADNLFVIGDVVHLVTQAFGATPDHKVVFELWDGAALLKSLESSVTANGVVVDHLKLENMVGGKFPIVARLVSPAGETVSTERAEITVSPRSVASRPGFVYRRGLDTRIPGLLSFMRGEQLWKLDEVANAKVPFEEALASNDRLVPARWMLANVHLKEEHPDDALALLEPLEEPYPNQFEVVAGLGLAHYLKGNYETAATYLSRARDIRPPEAMLWNALGDSYEHIGNRDKAREAFESSLQLDSEQPTVRERLASLNAQAEKNCPCFFADGVYERSENTLRRRRRSRYRLLPAVFSLVSRRVRRLFRHRRPCLLSRARVRKASRVSDSGDLERVPGTSNLWRHCHRRAHCSRDRTFLLEARLRHPPQARRRQVLPRGYQHGPRGSRQHEAEDHRARAQKDPRTVSFRLSLLY